MREYKFKIGDKVKVIVDIGSRVLTIKSRQGGHINTYTFEETAYDFWKCECNLSPAEEAEPLKAGDWVKIKIRDNKKGRIFDFMTPDRPWVKYNVDGDIGHVSEVFRLDELTKCDPPEEETNCTTVTLAPPATFEGGSFGPEFITDWEKVAEGYIQENARMTAERDEAREVAETMERDIEQQKAEIATAKSESASWERKAMNSLKIFDEKDAELAEMTKSRDEFHQRCNAKKTLRDEFAMAALTGLLVPGGNLSCGNAAETAYTIARCMLAERSKT